MIRLSIISQLLGFFALAIVVNQLSLWALVILLFSLLSILIWTKTRQFLRIFKRFKWFFLVLLLIFSFNTPGEHVTFWPFSISTNLFSPTYEGLLAGAMQTLRITCMLAALSLILAKNTKQQLISGFYFILSPLKYFGLAVERFAARLWLTLHYVELHDVKTQAMANQLASNQGLMSRLINMTDLKNTDIVADLNTIELSVPPFGMLDYLAIAILLLVAVEVFV